MATIRISVRPTKRTDLMCIGCGGFRTELEVVTSMTLGVETGEAYAGVHRNCVDHVHQKRATRR